jgi:hypothetical protein
MQLTGQRKILASMADKYPGHPHLPGSHPPTPNHPRQHHHPHPTLYTPNPPSPPNSPHYPRHPTPGQDQHRPPPPANETIHSTQAPTAPGG